MRGSFKFSNTIRLCVVNLYLGTMVKVTQPRGEQLLLLADGNIKCILGKI